MDKDKWEELVNQTEQRMHAREKHKNKLFEKYVTVLRRLITVELLIGIIAAFSMYMQFGWVELERTLLSWIIGITMVSTIITFMIDRYKKITHF